MGFLDNPFIAGTLAVVVTGAVMGTLYKLPPKLWRFLRNRFVVTVDVDNVDPSFRWLKAYLGHVASSPWLVAGSMPVENGSDEPWKPVTARDDVKFFLAPRGLATFRYRGHRVLAWVTKEALQNSIEWRETITLQYWRRGAGNELVKQLLEDARQHAINQGGRRVEIWMPSGTAWTVADRKPPRESRTLVLADGVLSRVIDDANQFLESRAWYASAGIPWRRNYLLHGPPGNGKSSLVHVLASEIGTHVNVANLSHFESDQQMVACLSHVQAGNVLLLEDIDATFDGRVSRPGIKVSFAALLNALDGMTAQDGRIVVMTTNHLNKLDPALIRPGRADVRVLIDNATPAQAATMYRRFNPNATPRDAERFGHAHDGKSMARIQELLLRERDGSEWDDGDDEASLADESITEASLAA